MKQDIYLIINTFESCRILRIGLKKKKKKKKKKRNNYREYVRSWDKSLSRMKISPLAFFPPHTTIRFQLNFSSPLRLINCNLLD